MKENKPNNTTIEVSQNEWDAAKEYFKTLKNPTLPMKIDRKVLNEFFENNKAYNKQIHHSFFVYPDPESSNGIKFGAIARGGKYRISKKGWFFSSHREVHEGILGSGAFAIVKTVQWENGSQDAIKIAGADLYDYDGTGVTKSRTQENDTELETEIMKKLKLYKGEIFNRDLGREKPWLGDSYITKKKYTLQKKIPGENLLDIISNPNLNVKDVLKVALGCVKSIIEIHEQGIIHGDVSPRNFMVDLSDLENPKVSLIDYGFAIDLDKDSFRKTGGGRGTESYRAPEIVNENTYSKLTDVYALGKIFIDKMLLNTIQRHSKLTNLISKMTDKDPSNRPNLSDIEEELKKSISRIRPSNPKP